MSNELDKSKTKMRVINIFVTPDLLRKWINNESFNQDEIILDPTQLEGIENLTLDLMFSGEICEKIIHGYFEKNFGNYNTRWELVNCTPEDKIRLLHQVEQKFISGTRSL